MWPCWRQRPVEQIHRGGRPPRRATHPGRCRPQLEPLEDRCLLSTLVTLTTNNQLLTFDSAAPATVLRAVTVTGLGAGEGLFGIDFRPATGQLYGLASDLGTARLVTVNLATGALTQVGASFNLLGSAFGIDFDPTRDRLRVVNGTATVPSTGTNLLIDPDTGAVTPEATTSQSGI